MAISTRSSRIECLRNFLEGTMRDRLMEWYIRQVSRSNLESISSFCWSTTELGAGDRNCAIEAWPSPAFNNTLIFNVCGGLFWQRQFELHSSLSENSAEGGWRKKCVQRIFLFLADAPPYITEKGVWHALQPYAGQVLWREGIHRSNKMLTFQCQNMKKVTCFPRLEI